MSTTSPEALQICEECDTVHRRRLMSHGDVAQCARCGATLEHHHSLNPNTMLALVLTAMLVFIQANVWPIVTLGLSGRYSSTTLWGAIIAMWQEQAQVIAVIAAITLFFFPLIKMLSIGWLLWFARQQRCAPGFVPIMVTLHYVGPWTMSEVFVLGALVAVVKAKLYFAVVADPGIYAYAVLTVLITIFAKVDMRELWDMRMKSSGKPDPREVVAVSPPA